MFPEQFIPSDFIQVLLFDYTFIGGIAYSHFIFSLSHPKKKKASPSNLLTDLIDHAQGTYFSKFLVCKVGVGGGGGEGRFYQRETCIPFLQNDF